MSAASGQQRGLDQAEGFDKRFSRRSGIQISGFRGNQHPVISIEIGLQVFSIINRQSSIQ